MARRRQGRTRKQNRRRDLEKIGCRARPTPVSSTSRRPTTQNAFVARFIGENNRLLGTVREVGAGSCVVAVEGGEVRALAVNVDSIGSRSTLSLRPERVPNAAARTQPAVGEHIRIGWRVEDCGALDVL